RRRRALHRDAAARDAPLHGRLEPLQHRPHARTRPRSAAHDCTREPPRRSAWTRSRAHARRTRRARGTRCGRAPRDRRMARRCAPDRRAHVAVALGRRARNVGIIVKAPCPYMSEYKDQELHASASEAVTNNVRVEVESRYAPELSRPLQNEWVFHYTVRITNE